MEEEKKTVVLYPGLAVSHFVPMMRFADALLDAGYAVTVALIDPTLKQDIAFGAAMDHAAASRPSVTFHTLPIVPNPPAITYDAQFLLSYLELVRRHTQPLHDFLCSIGSGVHALVMDMMSVDAVSAAKKLGVPAYAFFPSNASALAASIEVSSTKPESQPNFGEMGDAPLNLHGVPPVPASHLFAEMLESPGSEIYRSATSIYRRLQDADGILVKSFQSLEPRAVGALGGADPNCRITAAPVYCVGQLVATAGEDEGQKHECLAWLDAQPDRSVVFLCFGGTGAGNHSEKQVKEIAVGLENSGHRFLWVVRAPPPSDPNMPFDPRADPDLDALLPAGFAERTRGRGIIVKLWAPQFDVLHHRATGAFVTHCGWNSVLEAITAGVPMLCWPLYAEQKMNKVFMVEEYGVGLEMVGWQDGMVKAAEVEAKVRLVMEESEEGARIRARVAEHMEAAAVAWKDGGSSRAAFRQFLVDCSLAQRSPI